MKSKKKIFFQYILMFVKNSKFNNNKTGIPRYSEGCQFFAMPLFYGGEADNRALPQKVIIYCKRNN